MINSIEGSVFLGGIYLFGRGLSFWEGSIYLFWEGSILLGRDLFLGRDLDFWERSIFFGRNLYVLGRIFLFWEGYILFGKDLSFWSFTDTYALIRNCSTDQNDTFSSSLGLSNESLATLSLDAILK